MNSKHWSDEERAEFEALCERAHDEGDSTAERVEAFGALLDDAQQAHRFYATDVLSEATRRGLASIFTRWHKSRSQVAVAYNGAVLSKPRVIGTRRTDDDGREWSTQTLFDFMTWAELETKVQEYLRQVSAFKANIHTLVRLLELRDLAPAAATPADAAASLGTTIETWLGSEAA